jgi:hypothetical protein
MGGEYYRATRPAALATQRWGWEAYPTLKMATAEDNPGGPLSFLDPRGNPFTPDIIVVRPVREWTAEWTAQAQKAGQRVIADLDDDLWSHEHYDELAVTQPDRYQEWFFDADAVLVSTRPLGRRVRELGHRAPVIVAPNCYDPWVTNAVPRPGRSLGTRLWLSGRMEADLVLYDTLVMPLLESLDLGFIHVGAGDAGRFIDRGWPDTRLVERRSVVIPLLAAALAGVSIGTICLAEHDYNLAKTQTHAVELASMGLPLVAATTVEHYRSVPGRVDPTPEAVEARVRDLLDPHVWLRESDRARRWSRQVSEKSEAQHLGSLLRVVNLLLSR